MDLTELLKAIENRPAGVAGMILANKYLAEIQGCLSGGGMCPVNVFQLADGDAWKKELDAAASRVCFSAPELSLDEKSINQSSGITDGAVMEYDCTLVPRTKDRDGDLVEPEGLMVDVRMPLLWQHLQLQPIGKHVRVLSQDKLALKCKFAIADIPLGRDAATLAKFGALRKSHGFLPVELEPFKRHDGAITGWHVKKASMLEGSLVSIPANAGSEIMQVYEKEFDGVCTAFSRSKLETPVVKQWAKGFFDKRPAMAPGVDLAAKTASAEQSPADTPPPQDGDTIRTKAVGENDFYLENSWEWISSKLRDGAAKFLRSKDIEIESDYWCNVIATFNDSAIICCTDYESGKYQQKCYLASWSRGADGKPQWTGDPSAVEVKSVVVAKALELATQRDEWRMKAVGANLAGMVSAEGKADSPAPQTQTLQDAANALLGKAFGGGHAMDEVYEALRTVHEGFGIIRDRREAEQWEKELASL